ncbi:hypothetical protein AB0D49_06220 [Streptomyces sp. NPDC048290]|uniref:SCO4225 family membrane protein n=1 Tax=Streptomyces sp. NPDC048290 TaxID=3155811 RepID=UPI003415A553
MNRRTLYRFAVGNPASAVYLGAVGLSIAAATGVTLFSSDPGFVWVWPAFLTAPLSLLGAMPLAATETDLPAALYVGGIAVAALAQSLVVGTCFELLRGRGAGRPQTQ